MVKFGAQTGQNQETFPAGLVKPLLAPCASQREYHSSLSTESGAVKACTSGDRVQALYVRGVFSRHESVFSRLAWKQQYFSYYFYCICWWVEAGRQPRGITLGHIGVSNIK